MSIPKVVWMPIVGAVLSLCGCGPKSNLSNDGVVDHGTAIEASRSPAGPVRIREGGLYYLTGNRRCKGTGIIVESDNVTIDLMGHQLIGPGKESGENYGVLTNNHRNLEVCNGTIRDFGDRGIVDRGRKQESGRKRLIGLRVIGNGGCGICIGGFGNVVRNCTCSDNAISGMCPGGESIVSGNVCFRNGRVGIHSGRGCVITGNVVSYNGLSGICSSRGCVIRSNSAYGNNRNGDKMHGGIYVLKGCLVSENSIRDNLVNNIYVRDVGNVIEDNAITTDGKSENGIYLATQANRCSDNYVVGHKNARAGAVPEDCEME